MKPFSSGSYLILFVLSCCVPCFLAQNSFIEDLYNFSQTLNTEIESFLDQFRYQQNEPRTARIRESIFLPYSPKPLKYTSKKLNQNLADSYSHFPVPFPSQSTQPNRIEATESKARQLFAYRNSASEIDFYEEYFIASASNPMILHIYTREFAIRSSINKGLGIKEKYDEVYKTIPKDIVYETKSPIDNKTYRVIKLRGPCQEPSQKLVAKAFWYICDGEPVYIETYLNRLKQDSNSCHKYPIFQEVCICPADRTGIFCMDQIELQCTASISQNQMKQNSTKTSRTQDNSIKKNTYHPDFTSQYIENLHQIFTYSDMSNIDFYLTCQNELDINHQLNQRYEIIEGLCPFSEVPRTSTTCIQKIFQYQLYNSESNIAITNSMLIETSFQFTNYKRISKPITIFKAFTPGINNINGKQPIEFKLDFSSLPGGNFNIEDFLLFGKIWFTMKIEATYTSQFDERTFKQILINRSSILQQSDYVEPTLSDIQILFNNNPPIFIAFVTVAALASGFILTWTLRNVHKLNLLSRIKKICKQSLRKKSDQNLLQQNDNEDDILSD